MIGFKDHFLNWLSTDTLLSGGQFILWAKWPKGQSLDMYYIINTHFTCLNTVEYVEQAFASQFFKGS